MQIIALAVEDSRGKASDGPNNYFFVFLLNKAFEI